MRPRRLLPYALILMVMVGLTGCGIGPTDRPVDEGGAAAGESGVQIRVKPAPTPNDALTAEDQVRNFLQAAVGGLAAGNDNVKSFLTAKALARWVDPVPAESPSLSVIRIVAGPTVNAPVGGRTSVELDYQLIGAMNDQGRIDDLAPVATKHMTFWVVADPEGPVLIDEIQGWPGGLVISDEGLHNYYQMQPIYFWDTEYKLLVPDLRYAALTLTPDKRAKQVLNWLFAGPSPWLSSSVQRLPNAQVNDVLSQPDGTLMVDLPAAAAGTGDQVALQRLMYQIRWSLAPITGADTAKGVALRLDGQEAPVPVSDSDFRRSNRSRTYTDDLRFTYDIQQGTVVAASGAGSPVLAVGENTGVAYAAIRNDVGAFVRTNSSGRRSLQIVRVGAAAITAQVPASSAMGRPSFIPETDFVVVPSGGPEGSLYVVSTVDGSADDVSHSFSVGVTEVAVSPDGRRVAVVAHGEVYVSSLVVANNQVNLVTRPQQLLADRLTARAVTWTSESWLLVSGTSDSGQALWRVSSDGVLVEDLSGQLRGLSFEDLVCYPAWNGVPSWATRANVPAHATTPSGTYQFRSQPEPEGLTNPFFAS